MPSRAESKGQVGTGPCHAFLQLVQTWPYFGRCTSPRQASDTRAKVTDRVDHNRINCDVHRYAPVGCAVMRFRNVPLQLTRSQLASLNPSYISLLASSSSYRPIHIAQIQAEPCRLAEACCTASQLYEYLMYLNCCCSRLMTRLHVSAHSISNQVPTVIRCHRMSHCAPRRPLRMITNTPSFNNDIMTK